MEEITLRGLRFHTCVGILPHERTHPQALTVDITAWRIATEPGADVLDYRRLYAIVAGHVDTNAVGYLEGPAHAIVKAVLAEPGVVRARVVLRKPQVALPGPLDAAEVAVERTRDA